MLTFQDLVEVNKTGAEKDRIAFILSAISQHESSDLYRVAADADMYFRHMNPTIMRAEKIMYDALGRARLDPIAANHKIPCRYYYYFISQTVMYLLGNGVTFKDEKTKDKLGGPQFDHILQMAAIKALNAGVSFGFLNVDHVEILPVCGGPGEVSFVPIYDDENGALRAGVRYWQIDSTKPLRATLFEEDGFTEYIRRKGEDVTVLQEKRKYKITVGKSDASGVQILSGENWDTLPIVPMFNINRQSELVGGKSTLDAYDLMLSQLVNNVDEGALLYWIIQNADGMDAADDQAFIERIKTIHVAHTNDGQSITPQQIDVPFQASEASLERLRNQLFEDYMALDVKNIAGGAATATQIEAAYEPMNIKASMLETCVTSFVKGLLKLLGVDDDPTYQRDTIVNKNEEIQNILQAADHLSDEYVTKKLLTILGDIDAVEDVMKQRLVEDANRYITEPAEEGAE
jgi:SPP1 family phage portal protein